MKPVLSLCLLVTILMAGVHAMDYCDGIENYFSLHGRCYSRASSKISNPFNVSSDYKASLRNYFIKICSVFYPDYVTCMDTSMSACTQVPAAIRKQWLDGFSGRLCQGTSIKQKYLDSIETIVDLLHAATRGQGCLNKLFSSSNLGTGTQACYIDAMTSVGLRNTSLVELRTLPLLQAMVLYNKIGRNFMRCYRREIRQRSTCEGSKLDAFMIYVTHSMQIVLPPGVEIDEENMKATVTVELRKGKRHTVAAYGDPHIQTYRSGRMTCKGADMWTTYLDNAYLKIEGYNVAASPGSEATVINKLRINMKDKDTIKANYTVNDGKLKLTFDDGKTEVDYGTGGKAVISSFGKLVKIKHSNSGNLVIISSYAKRKMYPVLMVRLSESLLNESMGLLNEGCLTGINIKAVRRKRETSDCENACSSVSTKFQDTCEYDCTVTGDAELAKSTGSDMEEAEMEAENEDANMSDDKNKGPYTGSSPTIVPMAPVYMVITGLLSRYI